MNAEYARQSVTELRRELAHTREQRDSAVRVAHRAYSRLDQAERLLELAVTPGCDDARTGELISEFLNQETKP